MMMSYDVSRERSWGVRAWPIWKAIERIRVHFYLISLRIKRLVSLC